MTYQDIATMVSSIELPFAYYQWEENSAPALPYILFYYPTRNDFVADGTNYQKITQLNLEFYSKNKDFENEAIIEAVLEQYGLIYSKEEQYIPDDRMYEVLYTMNIFLEENNHES